MRRSAARVRTVGVDIGEAGARWPPGGASYSGSCSRAGPHQPSSAVGGMTDADGAQAQPGSKRSGGRVPVHRGGERCQGRQRQVRVHPAEGLPSRLLHPPLCRAIPPRTPGRASDVNTRWCGDITCIRTWEGWLDPATVIDLGSRRVVGWSTADHLRTDLIAEALGNAVTQRRPGIRGDLPLRSCPPIQLTDRRGRPTRIAAHKAIFGQPVSVHAAGHTFECFRGGAVRLRKCRGRKRGCRPRAASAPPSRGSDRPG